MTISIRVQGGCVTDVRADNGAVTLRVVDLDNLAVVDPRGEEAAAIRTDEATHDALAHEVW